MFDYYISGMGITKVARALEEEGIKNVSGNVSWSPGSIRGMLKNEKYVGDAILQKTITTNSVTFKRKKNEGEAPMYYIRDNHPAIVEREKFDRVQEIIKERSRSKGNTPEMAWKFTNRFPFTQKIICGNCGKSYRHTIRNTTYTTRQYYWSCATYINKGREICDMGAIKDATLRKLFVRVFNKLLTNRSVLANFAATLRLVNDVKISGGQLKDINEEVEALLKQEHVILGLYEKGVTDKAILRIEHEELIGKLGRLRAERSEIIRQIEGQDNRLRKTDELIVFFESTENPIEEFDEELFEYLIEKLVVKERECIVFCLANGMELEERYTIMRGEDKV